MQLSLISTLEESVGLAAEFHISASAGESDKKLEEGVLHISTFRLEDKRKGEKSRVPHLPRR